MAEKINKVAILKINDEFRPNLNQDRNLGDFLVGFYKVHFKNYHDLTALTDIINEYIEFLYINPSVLIILLRKFVPLEIAAQIISDIIMKEAAQEDLILSEIC